MSHHFKDREHLVRLAGLFVVGLVAFLALRGIFIPAGFGDLGHYRAGALADNRAAPLVHAGRDACTDCHAEVVEARRGGAHAGIGCETCHGPLAAHAAEPDANKPALPDGAKICLGCHTKTVARPASFPQVEPASHSGGERCPSCHKPHHPNVT